MNDVIMGEIASLITSPTIAYSTVYSDADQRKHQRFASLAFVWEFAGTSELSAQMASNAENVSFDDVIMNWYNLISVTNCIDILF